MCLYIEIKLIYKREEKDEWYWIFLDPPFFQKLSTKETFKDPLFIHHKSENILSQYKKHKGFYLYSFKIYKGFSQLYWNLLYFSFFCKIWFIFFFPHFYPISFFYYFYYWNILLYLLFSLLFSKKVLLSYIPQKKNYIFR